MLQMNLCKWLITPSRLSARGQSPLPYFSSVSPPFLPPAASPSAPALCIVGAPWMSRIRHQERHYALHRKSCA